MKKLLCSLMLILPLFLAHAEIAAPVADSLKPIKEVIEPAGSFPKDQFIKVAVIQNKQLKGASPTNKDQVLKYKQENRAELEQYIRKAVDNGASFVVTPEYGVVGYPNTADYLFKKPEDAKYFVETVPGASTDYFGNLAEQLKTYIVINLLEDDVVTKKYYNVMVLISPEGKVIGKHRKFNLFENEREFLAAGDSETIIDTPFGKLGLMVCADTYQILLLHKYLDKVDHFIVQASWTKMNSGWNYFKAASALTKTNYIVSNQSYFPDSGVINSDGSEQSHIRQSEGLAYGYLRLKKKVLE